MPKEGRIGDTILFIRNAAVVGGQDWGNPIADLLQEIPISAAVDQAMSQGTTGTELTRKYRRALTLILGNAYFLAVKLGGNWNLYGQQNNPGKPLEGVSNFQQLYP